MRCNRVRVSEFRPLPSNSTFWRGPGREFANRYYRIETQKLEGLGLGCKWQLDRGILRLLCIHEFRSFIEGEHSSWHFPFSGYQIGFS